MTLSKRFERPPIIRDKKVTCKITGYVYDIYVKNVCIYDCMYYHLCTHNNFVYVTPGNFLSSFLVAPSPPKQGRTSNQNSGHLGSRYVSLSSYNDRPSRNFPTNSPKNQY